MLLLLLALLWQSFILQTHSHGLAGPSTRVEASSQQRGGNPASDTPATCPICAQAAVVGPALLPTPATIVAPVAIVFFATVAAPRVFVLSTATHIWRSRAPPRQFQA